MPALPEIRSNTYLCALFPGDFMFWLVKPLRCNHTEQITWGRERTSFSTLLR